MKKLAIIPARGGSKRIPRKNIRDFIGKPIISYSIEAALSAGIFDEVMVSTDDNEIAEIAKSYGAKVPFFRSMDMADDYATTADVILEVLRAYKSLGQEFDVICCIYPTAPFIQSCRLIEACKMLESDGYDSIFTMVAFSYPIQRALKLENEYIRLIHPEFLNTRSQDLSVMYHDAGQFYFSKVDAFLNSHSFWNKKTGGIILSELEVQDIDSETDWKLAELKYTLLQ